MKRLTRLDVERPIQARRQAIEAVVNLVEGNYSQRIAARRLPNLNLSGFDLSGHGSELVLYHLARDDERQLLQVTGSIYALAFHPDNKLLAVGVRGRGSPPAVKIWNIDKTELVKSFDCPVSGLVNSLSFNADGTLLVGGFGENMVLWDIE